MDTKITAYAVAGVLLAAAAWMLTRRAVEAAGDAVAVVVDTAQEVAQAVNPVNPDNVFATASNKVTQTVTGDSGTTLGSKIYDWFHPNEGRDITAPTPITPKRGPYGQ